MRMTRRGFTMIELALALVVIGILAAMGMAKIGTTISRSKVDRAASIVAADLENAFSTGGRLRQPLVISCDCANRIYRVNDQLNGGALRLERRLGLDTPFTVDSMTFTPATVTFLPPGRLSQQLQVEVTVAGKTRRIEMSSAGFVRITTPTP